MSLDDFITAPTRSPAIPNDDGSLLLFTETRYSVQTRQSASDTIIFDTRTKATVRLPHSSSGNNFEWLGSSRDVIWQERGSAGTDFWVPLANSGWSKKHFIGSLNFGGITLCKVVDLPDNTLGALLLDSRSVPPRSKFAHSTGIEFDQLPVQQSSFGLRRPLNNLYFLRLTRKKARIFKSASWFGPGDLVDLLSSTNLDLVPFVGSLPIGLPSLDISARWIAFCASKKGTSRPGIWTSDMYLLPIPPPAGLTKSEPRLVSTPSCNGYCASPTLSPDGRSLAFLREEDQTVIYFSHRSIFLLEDCSTDDFAQEMEIVNPGRLVDLHPATARISRDGRDVYFVAVENGQRLLYRREHGSKIPTRLGPEPQEGSVVSYSLYTKNGLEKILLTSSGIKFATRYTRLETLSGKSEVIEIVQRKGETGPAISSAYYISCTYKSGPSKIQTFVVLPPGLDKTKKYPVAVLLHGGPVSAWVDSWQPVFNASLWAEAGYVVVMPNFTGSNGFTRSFRDQVWGDLGGAPYRDIVACMDFIDQELPYADTSRALALGSSYGGYLAFWIAGQPELASRFRGLLSHAGVFDAPSLMSSDCPDAWALAFCNDKAIAYSGDTTAIFDRWDPSRHAEKWHTPMLITTGQLDVRCPSSMSFAAFAAAKMKGVDARLLVFPDEGHLIAKPENSYHWYSTVIAWMNEHTK